MIFTNRKDLLPIASIEVEKRAPLVFAEGTEGFEAADETDVAPAEESPFILVINQRADVIGTKGKSPRAGIRGGVLDQEEGIFIETKVARLISKFPDVREALMLCQMPKDNAVKLVPFRNHRYKSMLCKSAYA